MENKNWPANKLLCVADGYLYQITGDDKNLYFHKVGREDSAEEGTMFGTMRVVKSQVEAVRCMRVRGKTFLYIVFDGETSKLEVKGEAKETQLMKIFGGVPLKLSINVYSNVLSEAYELRLLAACFIVTIVCVLTQVMGELAWLRTYVPLAWIAIPFLWLVPCASRMLKGSLRDQFPVGGGMLATMFSCGFLWASSVKGVENWEALILPSLIGAVIMGAVYLIVRKKFDPKALAAVILVSAICFTPAAVLCMNRALPSWSRTTSAVEVTDKYEETVLGEESCFVTVDNGGEQESHKISREDYDALIPGDRIDVVKITGLLGIEYTEVKCG